MNETADDETLLSVVKDLRNWIRAASHSSVKTLLEAALPDAKARIAYQMSDAKNSVETIRTTCKMSPNGVVALQAQCVSLGLMEITSENRRRRLFDLNDFGLIKPAVDNQNEGTKSGDKAGRGKR